MSTEGVLLLVSLGFGIAALGLVFINLVQLQRQLRKSVVALFLEAPQPETVAVGVRHNTQDVAEGVFAPEELVRLHRLRRRVQRERKTGRC